MAREKTTSNLPAVTVIALGRATRAENDEQLLDSWELGKEAPGRHLEVPATMGRRQVGKPAGGSSK